MNQSSRKILKYILGILYFLMKYAYKVARIVIEPIARSHPKLRDFEISVRDAFKDLIRPANTGSPQSQPQVLFEVFREVVSEHKTEEEIPGWLLDEWKEIHAVEPEIFPDRWLVKTVPFYQVPPSRVGEHYLELCQSFKGNTSHVFLVPWLKTGGADLVVINYIHALMRGKLSHGISVISTLKADSPWADRLPKEANYIEFGKRFDHLSEDEQEKLLTRVLLQLAPKVIHNINSDLGYRILVKYGKAMSKFSSLFVCSFCEEISEEGKLVGYPFQYLSECFDHLEGIFSDNLTFLNKLHDIYAFDRQKLHVHYQPTLLIPRKQAISNKPAKKARLDVLWAGRIDRQKRPDLLARIAEKCGDLPITFHVYGSSVMDMHDYTAAFSMLNNVDYHGAFNGLCSLPTDQYDLFLYTSQWDGLPNVLLEAITLGLPVIASNVGGISELIVHGKTGFLIDPFDDVDSYRNCLERICLDRAILTDAINNASELIGRRHSWEVLIETLKNIPAYTVSASEH